MIHELQPCCCPQLDAQIQTLMMQLLEAPEPAHDNGNRALPWPEGRLSVCPPAGDRRVRCLHDAQVCSEDRNSQKPSSPDEVNAPDQ